MKTVILAGGYGSRISEESHVRPKPMIEIGSRPILWHIMKGYSHFDFQDFVICLGFKGYAIKDYFANYLLHESDITFDFRNATRVSHQPSAEPWTVTLVDTGLDTQTGGRIHRVKQHLGEATFFLTYGDGVSDLDISAVLAFHRAHGKLATVTAVQPGGRFGSLQLNGSLVTSFNEKPQGDGGWINGGFFVLEPGVFDYIDGVTDRVVFEREPLERLAADSQLMAYKHEGFWHPMDTLRDKNLLENLWNSQNAPWKLW